MSLTLLLVNSTVLTLAAAAFVIVLFFLEVPLFELIELKTYDLRFQARDRAPTPADVALVMIDEKSIKAEGRWPWPRSKIARALDYLSHDGATVIGFDIGFLEPDENAHLDFIREMGRIVAQAASPDEQLAEAIRRYGEQNDSDLSLAEAMRRSTAAVVLGYFFHMSASEAGYPIEPAEIERRLERIAPHYPLIHFASAEAQHAPLVRAFAPEGNLPILAEMASSAGFYNVKSDRDGTVRWLPLVLQCGEHLYPPLALVCAWQRLGKPRLVVDVDRYGVRGVRLGDRIIPTDESGQLLINYLGPPRTMAHISISDVLADRTPPGTFRGRVVLIGMGIQDLRSTPVGPIYPGVEIQATAIQNILTGNFMAKPQWSWVYDIAAIAALCGLLGIAVPRLGAVRAPAFAALLICLHVSVAYRLFAEHRIWLNMVYPLMGLVLTYSLLTAHRYLTEQRERVRIKGTFSRYVAPQVIEKMLRDPGKLKLGGEEKELTVLFSDLWGFTGYAERYAPQEMVGFLSEYFERMTAKVFRHQGTLKEYVGDELMAIFGAPLDQPDHAARACAAALDMRRELAAMREEWTRAGRPALRVRMGINSGTMLVGNLGSRYRFAYGVLGDNVNLGSRLEGLNREYGTDILVGENTARLVGDSFRLRELDLVRVAGRNRPVRIYELVANGNDVLPQSVEQAMGAFSAGLERYRRQAWQEAMDYFGRCVELNPADGAARTMLERCRVYRHAMLGADWDGVFATLNKS
jgi:adenylate cyclase